MPAQISWMALRATFLATIVLGTAIAWTAGAMAYETDGTASTMITIGEDAVQDSVPASADRGLATVGVDAVVDMLAADGVAEPAPLQTMDGDHDWDGGWWIVMAVMMVLFWGAAIALVVWGVRQFTGDQRRDQSALDIARTRLAKGEITKEEFDRIRGDLT